MPQFPFVVIPATTNASQLHAQYPFLLLTIIAACSEDDFALQKTLDHEIKRQICVRIIMNDERSMDLLLGLLVHTAWYQYRFETIHTQMYLTLELAITLVVDLSLDQNSGLSMRGITAGLKGKGSETAIQQSSTAKRALLGVFHLTSVLSLFRPQLSMNYTDWINQCCSNLSESPEYPTDRLLRTYLDGSASILKDNLGFGSKEHGIYWNAVEHRQNELKKGYTAPHDMLHIDNWAYYFEVKAKPILLLGQILHYQCTTFTIEQMTKLDYLIHSTEDFIASFPRIPADRIVNLPLPFHTYMWYALLVLSKTLLLSNMDHSKTFALEASICGNTVAILNRMETLSTGQDLWANSRNIIGSMLSWLKDHMRQKASDGQPAHGYADISPGQVGRPASSHSIGELQLDDIPEEAFWNADWWQQMVEGPLCYPAVGSPSWLLPTSVEE
ncbi:uncharacterized protein LDX57_006137 [Aspergillus melleus]|uniref:uncharacterized protein n=1 Tax=Aspergillus melleus TaxID=138277 RepID=UPI001E8CDEBF|nr:uncharacterized protein LDX57_006137 [Aspergillus melleus]KAH8428439.1 hypothetical protein LDX57_006137 [Aspergillus melleus]